MLDINKQDKESFFLIKKLKKKLIKKKTNKNNKTDSEIQNDDRVSQYSNIKPKIVWLYYSSLDFQPLSFESQLKSMQLINNKDVMSNTIKKGRKKKNNKNIDHWFSVVNGSFKRYLN